MDRGRGMIHEDLRRKHELTGSTERAFGLAFAALCTAGAGIGWWIGSRYTVLWGSAASLFLGFTLLWPRALKPLNRLWFRFGLLLHRIINPLLMGVLFYFVVAPTGLALRAFGKDLLRLRLDRALNTYWIERKPPGPSPDTMKNQF